MTIKYVLNVGLMKGCSTGLEKQTRGRRRSRRSSNKKVKHGEKEEEEKSSSDDDSGIESLASFVYSCFQQIIWKKKYFFINITCYFGDHCTISRKFKIQRRGGGGVKDFFTIAKRHFFQLFSVLAALNFLNNYNFEYSGRRLYHYNEDDFWFKFIFILSC